jgi:phage protein U
MVDINHGLMETISNNNFGIPVIPGDLTQWPTKEIHVQKEQFQMTGSGSVSVWLNGYFFYRDEFGIKHASSFLFSFVTADGKREILPLGTVNGRFEPFGKGWNYT